VTPKDNQSKQKQVGDEGQVRREFLKKIGKGSATVPAAVLLLAAASSKQAQASVSGGCGSGGTGGGCACGGGIP
jgi:hypothetical protein